MHWTVVGRVAALNDLASIWLASQDRDLVAHAANSLDRQLQREPETTGEEFYGDRLAVEYPLAIVFTFSVDDRLVRVIQALAFDLPDSKEASP